MNKVQDGRLKRFATALRPSASVVAASLLSSALSVSATFYVTTHLKPRLEVDVAHGMVSVDRDSSNPNRFNATIIELFQPTDTKPPTARIYSPKIVTFNSAKDYGWDPMRLVSIDKLFIENDGWVTAKIVRVGVSVSESVDEPTIIPSPNIRIISQQFHPAGDNTPAYVDVEFDRLAVSDVCVLTILSRQKSKITSLRPSSNIPFVSLEARRPARMLLFIQSEEGVGEERQNLFWDQALSREKEYFPTTPTGFWLSNLTIRKGAMYKVEDDPNRQIQFKITNPETGATTSITASAQGAKPEALANDKGENH